jgi:hypothetical protein
VQISYRLEGAELQEARSASGSAVLRFVMNTRRLMYVGIGAGLCILGIVRVVQHAQGPDAFLFFLMGGTALFVYGYLPWRREQRSAIAIGTIDTVFKADESGIEIVTAASVSRNPWNAVQRWFETRNCIAVLTKKRQLLVLPKRVLPPLELDIFRDLLRRKLDRKEDLK